MRKKHSQKKDDKIDMYQFQQQQKHNNLHIFVWPIGSETE